MTTVGILTAGGDCPGLNAVIRAATTRIAAAGGRVVGFLNGWAGVMENKWVPLDRDAVRGILARGGTVLGTSRSDPYVHGDGLASVRPTLADTGVDALIVTGGDGTLRSAARLAAEGLAIVGVPKTIDNDIPGTDVTFGFHTAVQIATDAIDRLTTTAEAHNRVMLVEVMGRTQGWIAVYAGLAAGADVILIPEVPLPLEQAARVITERHAAGHSYSVVVVAEGIRSPEAHEMPRDAFGFERLGGVAYRVAPVLERLTGFETRVTVLGHLQRGGTPTAFDRVLATRLGAAAADAALAGETDVMVSVSGPDIVTVPLAVAGGPTRGVDEKLFSLARTFFG